MEGKPQCSRGVHLRPYDKLAENMHGAFKNCSRFILHRMNGLGALRQLRQRDFRILVYHQFSPDRDALESLERQCEHIRRCYRAVSMDEVADGLDGKSLPPKALAITVDDGYRNYLEWAHPIFRAHDLPVTVFLISDFLDGSWLWWDKVHYLITHTCQTRITIPMGPAEYSYDLSVDDRERVVADVIQKAKGVPNSQRLEMIEKLNELSGVRLPEALPDAKRPLSWDEVRILRKEGVSFGAHTKTHPIMARVESEAELCYELSASRSRIEEEIADSVQHFCYPNGMSTDFDDRCVRAVRECGFRTAVSSIGGANRPEAANRFALRRLGIVLPVPDLYFRETVVGLHGG